MITIIHCPYGDPEKVVGFTDEKAAVEYIKPHLKLWHIGNENYQCEVDELSSIEQVQELIEAEAIYTLQVYKVEMLG